MGKTADGRDYVATIVLAPRVRFSGTPQPEPAAIAGAARTCAPRCFIANSVTTEIEIRRDENALILERRLLVDGDERRFLLARPEGATLRCARHRVSRQVICRGTDGGERLRLRRRSRTLRRRRPEAALTVRVARMAEGRVNVPGVRSPRRVAQGPDDVAFAGA